MSVISTMSYDFLYLKYIQIGGTVDNPDYKDHFELGGALEPDIHILGLEWMSRSSRFDPCRTSYNSFLGKYAPRSLLIINPAARPTAEETLKHSFVSSV